MHGIGGCTVAEARERLSAREAQLWSAYIRRHGSLNAMQRADYNAGLLASLYANTKRKPGATPFQVEDFTRFHDEKPIGLDQAMDTWK